MISTRKLLDLCTSHVTEEVGRLLDAMSTHDTSAQYIDWRDYVVMSPWAYGWWVWAHQEDNLDELPECLRAAIELAKQHGCEWILFDCDTAPIEELPTYEW